MTRHRAKAPSQRQLRVGEQVRHILSELFARGGLRDPELTAANITVTEVRMSPDLKNATAFVTPLGGANLESTLAALKRAAPYLRGRLGEFLDLRHTPRLRFEPDRSFDEAARIESLLRQPRVRRDLADADDTPAKDGDIADDEDDEQEKDQG